MSSYLDYSERDDVIGGGARKIPIETPRGPFNVWVKRVGNNPDLRVLLLHGGPAQVITCWRPRWTRPICG